MWEIESLVEDSIRVVANHSNISISEKRKLIYNLYKTQDQFDCSFTHFRVMKLLLATGYAKSILVENYPTYQQHLAFFEDIQQKRFEYIYEKIGHPWSDTNQVCAYWDKNTNKIYYDCTSSLWPQLEQIEVPTSMPPMVLAGQIVSLAHETKHKELIYHWAAFSILYSYYFYPTIDDLDILIEQFTPIKKLFYQYDFVDFEPIHDSFDFKFLAEGIKEGYFEEKVVNLLSWFLKLN